jgi:hypothetical protein
VKDRLVFNAVLHDTEVETYSAAHTAATAPTAAAAASVALLVLAKLVSPSKGFGTVVTLQKIEQINMFFFLRCPSVTELYTLSYTIWVDDLGTEAKNFFV